jgi:hypothetical protein
MESDAKMFMPKNSLPPAARLDFRARTAPCVPNLRPAFLPAESLPALRDLKGFRHLVRHAYDFTLRADRIAEMTVIAREVTEFLPIWTAHFISKIRENTR